MNYQSTRFIRFVLLVIFALLGLCFFFGCTDKAYNRVATDTNRSERNTKILAQTCEVAFPQVPTYIKGKDSIRIDTAFLSEFVHDTMYLQGDTIIRLKTVPYYVTKTIVRTDTISTGDGFRVARLQLEISNLQTDLKARQYDNQILAGKVHFARKITASLLGLILLALSIFFIKHKYF